MSGNGNPIPPGAITIAIMYDPARDACNLQANCDMIAHQGLIYDILEMARTGLRDHVKRARQPRIIPAGAIPPIDLGIRG